jgi:predicted Holliday junction resolvase-like endonuclease
MSTLKDLVSARGLFAECPSCGESFALRDANLFDATKRLPKFAVEYLQTEQTRAAGELKEIVRQRAELKRRSSTSAESSGVGQIVEMLSPSLPGFPVLPSDCRALFKPIDYVGFKGLSISGEVDALVFIEVKSGRQRLSKQQRQIKSVVEQGGVQFVAADHQLARSEKI